MAAVESPGALTTPTILGYLGLFTLVAIMQGDNGPRRSVRCVDGEGLMGANYNILVVVPPVDFKLLIVAGQICDEDITRHTEHLDKRRNEMKAQQISTRNMNEPRSCQQ